MKAPVVVQITFPGDELGPKFDANEYTGKVDRVSPFLPDHASAETGPHQSANAARQWQHWQVLIFVKLVSIQNTFQGLSGSVRKAF